MQSDNTKELTGFPSIDKPWLKYYLKESLNAPLPECSLYEYLWNCNKDYLQDNALNFFGRKMTYGKLFKMIEDTAKAFMAIGVKEGEIVSLVTVSTVASVVCFYALNRIGAVSNFLNVLAEESDLRNYFLEAESRVVVSLDLFAGKVLKATERSNVEKVVVFPLEVGMPMTTKMGWRIQNRKADTSWKADKKVCLWNSFLQMGKGQPEIHYKKDPHKMCLLAHTGGTTGIPKAVPRR